MSYYTPKSLDQFYIVSYFIKWVKTSSTYFYNSFLNKKVHERCAMKCYIYIDSIRVFNQMFGTSL